MTPAAVSKRIVTDRLDLVDSLLREIRSLPLGDETLFFADRRNLWSAESCLRRSLEALFDVGRHILVKGYGSGVSEYKEIGLRLQEEAALTETEADLLTVMAGYRSRFVHFYQEISAQEPFEICMNQLGDLELIQSAYRGWIKEHPERVDSNLQNYFPPVKSRLRIRSFHFSFSCCNIAWNPQNCRHKIKEK